MLVENKKNLRDLLLAIGFSVSLILMAVFFSKAKLSFESHKLVGQAAPEIGYEYEMGQPRMLSEKKGATVLVNFWASWCAPCMEEMPELKMLEKHYENRGFVLLAINIENTEKNKIETKISKDKMPTQVIYNVSNQYLSSYGVSSIPLSVLIDKHGVIQRVYSGSRRWMDVSFLRELDEILKN